MTNEDMIKEIKAGKNVQSNMYQLYEQNLPLINRWAKRHISIFGADDVMQECYIALHNAVQTFENEKEYKFTTYLEKAVKTHLSGTLRNNAGVKLGAKDKRLFAEYKKLNERNLCATGEAISDISACEQLHCTEEQLKRIRQYIRLNNCKSLEQPFNDGDNDDLNRLDILSGDDNTEKEYEQQAMKQNASQIWDYVHKLCNEREANVIRMRYKEMLKLDSIGEILGVSRERARQIENNAFKRMRNDPDFKQWALDYDDICAVSYHYGFNSWKNNQQSSVELATERAERAERYRLRREARINAEIEQWLNSLLQQA